MTNPMTDAPRDGTEVRLRIGSLLPELWISARWEPYGGTRATRTGWVSDEDGIYPNDDHFSGWRPA